ncbi:polyprenyl synthetase family protein [Streptomyces sp. CA-250714]|uniref:polyprenyl synthetase family protein n=1 Tax=Streptomyces sp. CA-250714 TaxID=3240060 RepID=UPI003D8C68C9
MSLPGNRATWQEAETRVQDVFPQVRRYLTALLDDYCGHHDSLRSAVQALIAGGRETPHEFSLPLLVHAAVNGEPEPAVPVAGVHALWWRSANVLDDFVDGDVEQLPLRGVDRGVAMMAALEAGYALPLRALEAAPLPVPLRRRLTADYLDGWTRATDGQIGDILNRPQDVGTDEVLEVYRKKSASIYEMACLMAARLAHGTRGDRPYAHTPPRCQGRAEPYADGALLEGTEEQSIAAWGEFGHILGLLAQFRNDHDDLCGGPGEDLRNGTATYLLVHLLRTAPVADRERALALLDQAATVESKRRELADMMRAPEVVRPYNRFLAELSGRAYTLLDTLAPASPFADCLRARVDAETMLLEPTRPPALAGRAG